MRESNRLSAPFVNKVKTAGIYRDGDGLLLRVEESGSKRWVLRTTFKGKRRDVGLGSARDISLHDVRDEARDLRKAARNGHDPIARRRQVRQETLSFDAAAERIHRERVKDAYWQNGKHRAQWITTLRTYAFPAIGKLPVGEVQSADVLRVLSPIWLTKPETARRVRQRIRTVLDWAVAAGHRSSLMVNAADAVRSGLPKQPREVRHHPAVPWTDIPAFARQIRETPSDEAVRLALEFALLTAMRSGEVRGARWTELDADYTVWSVPARRMKRKRAHRVPLSDQARQILRECRARWPNSELIFPGRDGRRPLSDMTLVMLMRRLGREEVPHGLRSSFRDWAADNRRDPDLAEAALAHALRNKTEAAYQRSDLFEARRKLMQEWADFACQPAGGRRGQR